MSTPFKLAPLPWDSSALDPVVSAKTISFHYGKHHQAYVDTLNKLVDGTAYADMKLEKIVQATMDAQGKEKKIFNNAAQVWNHDFYWRSLTPARTEASGRLASAIARDFGGTAELIAKLAEAGKEQFGSGWAWLVSKDGKLSVEKTANAETPMAKGINCLLTVDVWEHAYYLDYQNARPQYLEAVLDRLAERRDAGSEWILYHTPVHAERLSDRGYQLVAELPESRVYRLERNAAAGAGAQPMM